MTATTHSAHSAPAPAGPPPGRGRTRAAAAMPGPAFIASVACIDPGNIATNIQAGARYGYLLLWAVLAANLMAMLVRREPAAVGAESQIMS